jgi:Uncharacterized protein conserved in bacteria (DUF2090)
VAGHRRRWLLELLVPPTRQQLADHEDQALYDREKRSGLTAEVIARLTEAGVRSDIWKLEGYEKTDGAQLVLDAIKHSTDQDSASIVLGRNAPQRQVDHWLDVAAPLAGYVGFAVGRSIWEEPLTACLAGRADRDAAQERISGNYRHFKARYLDADTALATSATRRDRNRSPTATRGSLPTARRRSGAPPGARSPAAACCPPGWPSRCSPKSTRCGRGSNCQVPSRLGSEGSSD